MSSLFLRDDLESADVGSRVSLLGAEAKHAVTVNRTRLGEAVSIGNGRGLVVSGSVVSASPAELVLQVAEVRHIQKAEIGIHLAQALAKGGRDEMAVQAATELGVDGVIPWAAARSVSRWEGAKLDRGRERWTSIVREATKQSIRAWVPEVHALESTAQLAGRASAQRVVVLEPTASTSLSAIVPDGRQIVLVVGPEGGISPSELEAFAASGAEAMCLGSGVLRTSTAGPAALAVLNAALGRW
jgi:16S rRNA (uracil1498-N3)-methyltransferase